jgi:hypothetical protein
VTIEAVARIATDRADRYIDQLCGHRGHLGRIGALHNGNRMPRVLGIERGESGTRVRFDLGTWHLAAAPDALAVRVCAEDAESLERLKGAVAARITKIGRRDGLALIWQDADAERSGRLPG